jgi:hypothetical protein
MRGLMSPDRHHHAMNPPTNHRRRPERRTTRTASPPITDADVDNLHGAVSSVLVVRTQEDRPDAPDHAPPGIDGPVSHGIPSGGS